MDVWFLKSAVVVVSFFSKRTCNFVTSLYIPPASLLPINTLLLSLINLTLNKTFPMPAQAGAKVPILAQEFLRPCRLWLTENHYCFLLDSPHFTNETLISQEQVWKSELFALLCTFRYIFFLTAEKMFDVEILHWSLCVSGGFGGLILCSSTVPTGRAQTVRVKGRAKLSVNQRVSR